MKVQIYGISNCSTVRKTRKWLEENQVEYDFHDFKKEPPTPELLESWLTTIPLSTLVNRKGATWRQLTREQKVQADNYPEALSLLQGRPNIIKRPVIEAGDNLWNGFDEEKMATLKK